MARPLNTPITDDGVASIRFFNGRVLSAADLQDEQDANRLRRAQVGRALGTGIASGFQVEAGTDVQPQTLRVRAGLAISPSGHPVELPTDATVSVVDPGPEGDEPPPETSGQFAACTSLPSVQTTGAGAYLLVACPATEPRERAPRVDPIGDGGRAESCGPKYAVEGVRFRLVHLDVGEDDVVPEPLREELRRLMDGRTLDRAEQSRLRNLIAHWCLATVERRSVPADLYDRLARRESFAQPPVQYGPIDRLRASEGSGLEPRLSSDDVPLAVFVWDDAAIQFVDTWAVRRRMHRTGGAPEAITDRQRAEGEAVMRQFQAHIGDLSADERSGSLADVEMTTHFRYLPPVALLPRVNSLGRPGIVPDTFLASYPVAPLVYIEGRQLPRLIHHAALAPPVDLHRGTGLRMYQVRESDAARDHPATVRDQPSSSATPYLVLASAGLPRLGDPRYDLSHWDYAHVRDMAIDG